ncbi:MAG: Peptidase protein, partial [Patescibacteria group bacterium]|nr:Peptidase protein [Patescibacteria group bacterium]
LVNNSEKMTNSSNGNVGIGSTGPIHTLDIARAAAGEGAAIRLINTTATGYTALRFGDTTAAGSDSYIHNFNSTWTQSNYWIPSTMGIGAGGNGIVLAATDTVNGEIQMFTGTASTSPDFMLAANGNVGIADSTPTFKLDVNGTGRFVGNVTAPTFVGALSGNATTATALAANGGNCSSGQFPLGVNASGAVETCSTSLSGNASTATTLATARTIWGQSFNGSANITGALTVGDTNTASNGAIEGTNNISGGYGVWGTSNAGYGVYGYANGNGRGVNGQSTGTGGVGVRGVGVSGGGYDFLADGTGVDYGVGSSIRWKRDLAPLENALDKVLAMRGLYYTWDEAHGGFRDMGMIAEEVLLQVPEIVAIDPSAPGFASGMDYGKLTPVLVEAIKEQQRQIVSLSNNGTSQLTFTSEGELAINGSAGNYTVTPTGQSTLTTVIGASKAVVGKITAGLINTRELVVQQSATIASLSVNSLTVSGQSISTYIRNIVQQELQTTSLPPGSVAQDFSTDNLTVTEDASISGTLAVSDIQADSVTATASTLGYLLADTASISGNLTVEQDASVAGTLIAGNITAESSRFQTLEARMAELENIKAQTAELVDATVSGTLYADSIYNFDEKIAESFKKPSLLELLTDSDPEAPEAASPASIYEPVEMAGYASTNPDIIATDSAILALDETDVVLGASALFVEKYLEVNGHGYVAQSLGVGETLKIGNSLIFTNGSINYQPAGVENPVLAIQSSGQGKLDFLAGVMTIENGQVAITGDLHVAGRIKTDTLLTNLVQPADFGNPFQVQVAGASTESGEIKKSRFEIIDENGEAVATFDSEGNASFQGGISVANQNLAEEEPDDDTVTTEKSSGQAKLRSGKEELKIQTPKATPDSLIYVTPKGSTDNKVLYIKGQGDGEFTVGFDDAIGNDVEFNWWIVN